MKHYSKYFLAIAFFIILIIGLPSLVHAQPLPDPCTGADEYCPIDGGLSALLAIGVGYGIKKYKDIRRTSAHSQESVSK